MAIKLVMFDLDGTLVDTSRDITNALNYALNSSGLQSVTVGDTIRMVGEGVTRLIEKVLGKEKIHAKAKVIKTFLEYYSAHLTDYSSVYPYVKETLEILSGVRKAVISNKREDLSRNLLNKLDLLKYFEIVAGGDTTAEKKPSAMPIMYILDKLAVREQEAIMVGDTNYDIDAGKKAGVKTVAVTYGFREKKYLVGADYMVDSMKDILGILDIDYSKFI